MKRLEVNVQTGEQKLVSLTPEEEADALAATAAEAAAPKIRPPLEILLDKLIEKTILTKEEADTMKPQL